MHSEVSRKFTAFIPSDTALGMLRVTKLAAGELVLSITYYYYYYYYNYYYYYYYYYLVEHTKPKEGL